MITQELLVNVHKCLRIIENKVEITVVKDKATLSREIIGAILSSEDLWISICPLHYNRAGFLERFKEELKVISSHFDLLEKSLNYNYVGLLDDYFVLDCLSFLREAALARQRQDDKSSIDTEQQIWNRFFYGNYEFSELPRYSNYLKYILNQLPFDIFNYYLTDKSLHAFLKYEELSKDVDDKINLLNNQLNHKMERAEELDKRLEDIKAGYNFVSLSQGFEGLLKEKKESKDKIINVLCLFGIFMLFPILYDIKMFINENDLSWISFIPSIGAEIILIYFFRIVLKDYYSLQTQIIQLELRRSLCQFIQDYADYAKEIKGKDKQLLEKFEKLIFSSIVPDSNKIPGTFDGIESLATLIQTLKKG